jgi:hypothetical protein
MASVGGSMMQMQAQNEVNAANRAAAEKAKEDQGGGWLGTLGKVASIATLFI